MIAEIKPIKDEYEEKISEQEHIRKPLLGKIEVFFRAHESEVEGRSWEGIFGKCGLRLSPPSLELMAKMTWQKVLLKIVGLGYKKTFLRPLVYNVRHIKKDELLSDKVLDEIRRSIGVKKDQEENFWYEVKPKV